MVGIRPYRGFRPKTKATTRTRKYSDTWNWGHRIRKKRGVIKKIVVDVPEKLPLHVDIISNKNKSRVDIIAFPITEDEKIRVHDNHLFIEEHEPVDIGFRVVNRFFGKRINYYVLTGYVRRLKEG